MKKLIFYILIIVLIPLSLNAEWKQYVKHKFFIQTKSELRISEATGQISLKTGIASLDEKNSRYRIMKIKQLFRLNNGNQKLFDELGMGRIYVVYLDTNYINDIARVVYDYSADENLEYAEPVFIGEAGGKRDVPSVPFKKTSFYPDDEMFYMQWYLNNTGNITPSSGGIAKKGADIAMLNGWEIEQGDEDIVIAILDSGIKDDHPEFRGRLWINKNEIPYNGIDDDRNGYVDDINGYDFAYDDSDPNDGFGHGTNIASVIGANANNTIGFAGINFKSKMMICKNLSDKNSGEYEWWALSVKYAVDNGAKIINMSEGGEDFSRTLELAVKYAVGRGALITAAMMNKGNSRNYYPASYKGVFAVGATDTDDSRSQRFSWGGGSCWGSHISVVAPGNKIYGLDHIDDTKYDVSWSGTSQSTAVVSAIASLLLSQKPERSSDDLKNIIIKTARDKVGNPVEDKPGWDQYYGWGRVDANLALRYELPETEITSDKDREKYISDTEKKDVGNNKENSVPKNSKAVDDNPAGKSGNSREARRK
ncbi:MAG: S8 family serine peptidase [Ignavibacteria bacterium]|nr:S8 family serine peptidase [Ignavibacteria bacterium]